MLKKEEVLKISPCLTPHSDVKDLPKPFANFIPCLCIFIHGKYNIKHIGRYIRLKKFVEKSCFPYGVKYFANINKSCIYTFLVFCFYNVQI